MIPMTMLAAPKVKQLVKVVNLNMRTEATHSTVERINIFYDCTFSLCEAKHVNFLSLSGKIT